MLFLAAGPPVSGDPEGVQAWAKSGAVSPRVAAEALLLTQDPQGALEQLHDSSDAAARHPQSLRLEVDAYRALGEFGRAERRLERLAEHRGWEGYAVKQGRRLKAERTRRRVIRIGLGLFALSLALLGWAGARELLRINRETVVLSAVLFGALMLSRSVSTGAELLVGLFGAATILLMHAAFAAVRRILPGVRGRLLFATLVLLGAGGVFVAQGAQLGWRLTLRMLGGGSG